MHPSIRQAYEAGTHPLAQHPIHGVYGRDLAFGQYEHIKGQYARTAGQEQLDMADMMRTLNWIRQTEADHKEELEKLAKKIVAEIWGASPDIFEAEIGEAGGGASDEEGEIELTPEQLKEVHKRITLNTLTHGAAIHQMTTLHHMVKEALDKIDPDLLKAYDNFARGSVYSSWFASIEAILALAGIKGGEVEVDWENDQPKIKAKGVVFPVLVHELSKGVMELITAHGLPQDEETLRKVLKAADRYETEVFHFFVGPELWRRFLKVVDQRKLPQIIMSLSKQEPDDLHDIIGAIVDNPDMAKQMINDLITEPEGFDVKTYEEGMPEEDEVEEGRIRSIADMISEDPDIAEAAPAAPPKEAPVKPETPEKDKPDPFRPPKPAVQPKPKAYAVERDGVQEIADTMEDGKSETKTASTTVEGVVSGGEDPLADAKEYVKDLGVDPTKLQWGDGRMVDKSKGEEFWEFKITGPADLIAKIDKGQT
jgi:hypothetical protein